MIYFKIFDISDFDIELEADATETGIETGNTDNGYVYHFHGSIEVETASHYQYEKKHPFEVGKHYRHGKHFIDTLKISIVSTQQEYENLYFASLRNSVYLIAWDTCTGFQYRWLDAHLPYPSKIRFLKDKAEFTVQTRPYFTINRTMDKHFMKNFRFNLATINTTVFN